MGLFYLFIVVVAITATALVAKLASLKEITPLDLATALFIVSTILGLVVLWPRLPMEISGEALLFSTAAGVGGSLAVLAFNAAIRVGHFGFSNAIYRASFLVPVVYAILFLGAVLKFTTIAGIVLVLSAIFLMSCSTSSFQKGKKIEFRWFLLIILAFLLSGAPRVGQALTSLHGVDYFLYLFLSYMTGTLVLAAFAGVKRSFNPASIPWGSAAAVSSYASVFCTLKALDSLQPQVVFPISLSGPIALGVLLSLFMFKERIRPSGWVGILLGIAGIAILAIWR